MPVVNTLSVEQVSYLGHPTPHNFKAKISGGAIDRHDPIVDWFNVLWVDIRYSRPPNGCY